MKRFVLALILFALMASGCCPITSLHPLTPQAGEVATPLAGIWQLDTREDKVFLHIGRAQPDHWQILLAEHKADGKLEQATFKVATASIGTSLYLNLDLEAVNPSRREGQEGHIILNVLLPDRYTLVLRRMRLERIAAAIGSGAVSGDLIYDTTTVATTQEEVASGGRKIDCAQLTATSAELHRFLAQNAPDELFEPYLTFKRVACIP